MGRPFMFALSALGGCGAEHVMNILKADLLSDTGLLGSGTPSDLPTHLIAHSLPKP
jgi:hypothetical protein